LTIRQQQSPCLTKNEHSSVAVGVAGTEAAGTVVSKRMRRRRSSK